MVKGLLSRVQADRRQGRRLVPTAKHVGKNAGKGRVETHVGAVKDSKDKTKGQFYVSDEFCL